MDVTFTEEQFRVLIELVSLGNWIANGPRSPEEQVKRYADLEEYILATAYRSGFTDIVEFDREMNAYHPTGGFEDSLQPYIEEYDEDNFWDELIYRLAHRDFVAAYGKAIAAMTLGDRMEKEQPFLDKYFAEISERGIERLKLAPSS